MSNFYYRLFILLSIFFVFCRRATLGQENLPKEEIPQIQKKKKVRILPFPLIERSEETDWVFGFALWNIFKTDSDSLTKQSNIPLGLLYTLRNQLIIAGGGAIFFPEERFILKLETSYTSFPDRFWGLGNNTPESNREDYSYQQFFFNPQFLIRLKKKLYWGIRLEMQKMFKNEYGENSLFIKENITGRDGGFNSGVGLMLSIEKRNHAFNSDKGFMLQTSYTVFSPIFGGEYQYEMYRLDFRKYLSLYPKHVIAFQVFSILTSKDPPFRGMPQMGSPIYMRGYYAGRFRDKNMFTTQVEYRMPLFWRLGLVGFLGAGQVSHDMQGFALNQLKHSMGLGVRFQLLKNRKVNLRIDYGVGEGAASNWYVVVSEAF